MAIIFMAKTGEKPVGFYSTYELAASVSPDVEEIDVPVLKGVSNGCVFYADAFYSFFSIINGIPKETNVIIGPRISRSANAALTDLHAEAARRRLSGCELDHFLCFEIDSLHGESLVEKAGVCNDPCAPHFTCSGNCKHDPLIQKTWNMLSEGKTWDLEHLTLSQLIHELSMYKPGIDLTNRSNSFTSNLAARSLAEMCMNNASVRVLAGTERADTLEKVRINEVGYLVFMDEAAVEEACTGRLPLQKDRIRTWKFRDVIKYFGENEEYGIYFVQSLDDKRYLFVDRMLLLSVINSFDI